MIKKLEKLFGRCLLQRKNAASRGIFVTSVYFVEAVSHNFACGMMLLQ